MTTFEYLSSIRIYARRIEISLETIAKLEQIACSISAPPTDREKVQSSRKGDKISDNVAKMVDIEREDYLNYNFKRKEIIKQIESLDSVSCEMLLEKFVQGKTIELLSSEKHLGERQIHRLIKTGMDKFEKQYGHIYLQITNQLP